MDDSWMMRGEELGDEVGGVGTWHVAQWVWCMCSRVLNNYGKRAPSVFKSFTLWTFRIAYWAIFHLYWHAQTVMITNDPTLCTPYWLSRMPLPACLTPSPNFSPLITHPSLILVTWPIAQPHRPSPSPVPVLNFFMSGHVLCLLKLCDVHNNELCLALCKFIEQLLLHCKMSSGTFPFCNTECRNNLGSSLTSGCSIDIMQLRPTTSVELPQMLTLSPTIHMISPLTGMLTSQSHVDISYSWFLP